MEISMQLAPYEYRHSSVKPYSSLVGTMDRHLPRADVEIWGDVQPAFLSSHCVVAFRICLPYTACALSSAYMLSSIALCPASTSVLVDLVLLFITVCGWLDGWLSAQEQFREHYFDNRKRQLNADLEFSTSQVRAIVSHLVL